MGLVQSLVPWARPMKLATPMGATSGNKVQVSLPAVFSIIAVGWADVVAAGLAAAVAADFFAGAVFAAGLVCDAAEHAAGISRQIERQIRIDAPKRRASPGRAGEDTCPYVGCDDCEVRFYPRVRKKLLTGRGARAFGLHLVAYAFYFAEDAQQISAENFADIVCAVAAVEQRLRD